MVYIRSAESDALHLSSKWHLEENTVSDTKLLYISSPHGTRQQTEDSFTMMKGDGHQTCTVKAEAQLHLEEDALMDMEGRTQQHMEAKALP